MFKLKPIAFAVVCAYVVTGCAGFFPSASEQDPASPGGGSRERRVITAEAMYRLGRFYQGQARYAEAIGAYREALNRHPSYVEARNGLGVSLAGQGRYD